MNAGVLVFELGLLLRVLSMLCTNSGVPSDRRMKRIECMSISRGDECFCTVEQKL